MDNVTIAHRFANLLQAIENVPATTPIMITLFDRIPSDAPIWSFEAKHIKDVLLTATVEIPALRKELDRAHGDIETLQEQIAGGKSANEMDTVLKRALHHLEKYASYYYSSVVDEVVLELRQLVEGLCSREDGGVGQARVYHSMLAQIEKLPSDAPVKIKASDNSFYWDVMAVDIKNLLMSFLFVVPALRNERNSALKKVEMLQEQISVETLSFEPPKWEYIDVSFNPANIITRFNEMGGDSWELAYCNWDQKYAIFKRQK